MNLLLFNIKTDAADGVLGFTTDWINEFAKVFDRVYVITLYSGEIKTAENVSVFSITSSWSGKNRIKKVFVLYQHLFRLLRTEKIDVCFSHMSPILLLLSAPLLALRRIPMTLWYAHRKVTLSLWLAHLFVKRVFSSTELGFQLKSHKRVLVGNAVNTRNFMTSQHPQISSLKTLVTVGRISRIKRLDIIISGFASLVHSMPEQKFRLLVVGGPLTEADKLYQLEILDLVQRLGVKPLVEFQGNVPYRDIPRFLRSSFCFINAAPDGAIDKAALEAASVGLPVLAANESFIDVFGRELSQDLIFKPTSESLGQALVSLCKKDAQALDRYRRELSRRIHESYSLEGVIHRIFKSLRDIVAEKSLTSGNTQ